MSHDDDLPRSGERDRDERRDPYEARRRVRTYGDDDRYAAEQPSQAAHPRDDTGRTRAPRWSEQPERYGGGYRDDEPWSTARGARGDARYGYDTRAERDFGRQRNEDDVRRAHGRNAGAQRDYGRNLPGQSNSGYDSERAYGQGRRQDDAGSDAARASWTQEHDYTGPRYGQRGSADARGDYGMQGDRRDTYGSEGFAQEGKRYWFDESDERGQFRGTRPRGYERSDERLRELICERLTDADVDASDIEVKVSQGTVTLEGSVRARWMKHRAEDIVDDLGGVKDIQNHLRVAGRGGAEPAGASPGAPAGAAPAQGTGTATPPATGTLPGGGEGNQGGDLGGRSRH